MNEPNALGIKLHVESLLFLYGIPVPVCRGEVKELLAFHDTFTCDYKLVTLAQENNEVAFVPWMT